MSNLATHEFEQAMCLDGHAEREREMLMHAAASLHSPTPKPPAPEAQNYLFDLRLMASVRVQATSRAEARRMIAEAFTAADGNFGAWPNGDPITAEAAMDGTADLIEINGESI
ncbi:hypothetical protein [Cereibacter changlensis]|uniref:hypothetical protein n=1 Tax=Cereibacter changlensis TaxID=402884 RepID=UPI00403389D5